MSQLENCGHSTCALQARSIGSGHFRPPPCRSLLARSFTAFFFSSHQLFYPLPSHSPRAALRQVGIGARVAPRAALSACCSSCSRGARLPRCAPSKSSACSARMRHPAALSNSSRRCRARLHWLPSRPPLRRLPPSRRTCCVPHGQRQQPPHPPARRSGPARSTFACEGPPRSPSPRHPMLLLRPQARSSGSRFVSPAWAAFAGACSPAMASRHAGSRGSHSLNPNISYLPSILPPSVGNHQWPGLPSHRPLFFRLKLACRGPLTARAGPTITVRSLLRHACPRARHLCSGPGAFTARRYTQRTRPGTASRNRSADPVAPGLVPHDHHPCRRHRWLAAQRLPPPLPPGLIVRGRGTGVRWPRHRAA